MANIILEIHHINVGTGDATLIIMRDVALTENALTSAKIGLPATRTEMIHTAFEQKVPLDGTVLNAILIDGGNDKGKANKINNYLKKAGVQNLNYYFTSHYHRDHIGGTPGINAINRKETIIYDRGNGLPYNIRKPMLHKYRDSVKVDSTHYISCKWRDCVDVKSILLGKGTNDIPITLKSVVADSVVFNGTGASKIAKNENDFSLGWLLQYGKYVYLTSGDLGGTNQSNYVDLETPMIKAINDVLNIDHICTFKLDHHGSGTSNNEEFIEKMKPSSVIISCGDVAFKGAYHPHPDVINYLEAQFFKSGALNTIEHYYVTSLRNDFRDNRQYIGGSSSKAVIGGDIVCIVEDDTIGTMSKYGVYFNGDTPTTDIVKDTTKMRAPTSGIHYFSCH